MIRKLAILLGVLVIAACGGGGGGGTSGGGSGGGSSNGVTLNVYNADLAFGQNLNLVGSVPGGASQTLVFSATAGTLNQTAANQAVYTAPSTVGNHTITVRSFSDNSKFATCLVRVSQVGINIAPESITLAPGAKTNITATVTGTSNTGVRWTSTGGTINGSGNTIEYTAPTLTGSYTVTATSSANSSRRAEAFITVANVGSNATVRGRVVDVDTTAGVGNIAVAFYNAAGAELGRVRTGTDGRFSAVVPSTAKRFHVVSATVPDTYYKGYEFSSLRYTTLAVSCSAPLPNLTAGSNVALASDILMTPTYVSPPPPPNGCVAP